MHYNFDLFISYTFLQIMIKWDRLMYEYCYFIFMLFITSILIYIGLQDTPNNDIKKSGDKFIFRKKIIIH